MACTNVADSYSCSFGNCNWDISEFYSYGACGPDGCDNNEMAFFEGNYYHDCEDVGLTGIDMSPSECDTILQGGYQGRGVCAYAATGSPLSGGFGFDCAANLGGPCLGDDNYLRTTCGFCYDNTAKSIPCMRDPSTDWVPDGICVYGGGCYDGPGIVCVGSYGYRTGSYCTTYSCGRCDDDVSDGSFDNKGINYDGVCIYYGSLLNGEQCYNCGSDRGLVCASGNCEYVTENSRYECVA
jgi:hypothetical protein